MFVKEAFYYTVWLCFLSPFFPCNIDTRNMKTFDLLSLKRSLQNLFRTYLCICWALRDFKHFVPSPNLVWDHGSLLLSLDNKFTLSITFSIWINRSSVHGAVLLITSSCFAPGPVRTCWCHGDGGMCVCLWAKHEPSSEHWPSYIYNFFSLLEVFIEILVDPHVVVRNNVERTHAFFTQFLPVIALCKIIAQCHN